MSFFAELKRRNVVKVSIAYIVLAWLVIQVVDVVLNNVEAPVWVFQVILLLLGLGLLFAIFFSWAFELTPEGLRLDKDVDRSQSISHKTSRKLDFVIIGMLAVAVIYLVADKFFISQDSLPTAQELPISSPTGEALSAIDQSVAVLPFRAMSGGENDGYFADGLTEEILNSLAKLPELLVTARTSSFFFKNKDIPIPEIAKTLGVAHVVEGSVRRAGDTVRITAQLVRASDGFHLWSQSYDRTLEDVFAVQEDIAINVATALTVVMDEHKRQQLFNTGIRDIDAFIAYQKAYEAFDQAHFDLAQLMDKLKYANELFEQALEIDPEVGQAWFLHSDYFGHKLYINSVLENSSETYPDTEIQSAHQTLISDMEQALANTQDPDERLMVETDYLLFADSWQGMENIVDRALASDRCVTSNWIVTLAFLKQEPFYEIYSRLTTCDPLNFLNWLKLIIISFWSGDAELLRNDLERGIEVIGAETTWTEFYLLQSYLLEGDFASARTVPTDHQGEAIINVPYEVNILAAEGRVEEANKLFKEMSNPVTNHLDARMMHAAITGNREEANRLAATIDSRPLSALSLLFTTLTCGCGEVFDLEAAPSFKTKIEESGLPWPPATMIQYPAKDW